MQRCFPGHFGEVSVRVEPSEGNRQIPSADPWKAMVRRMENDGEEATGQLVSEGLVSELYRQPRHDWSR
jgi:hypothetical protein